jgi:hypothetical protein
MQAFKRSDGTAQLALDLRPVTLQTSSFLALQIASLEERLSCVQGASQTTNYRLSFAPPRPFKEFGKARSRIDEQEVKRLAQEMAHK